MKPSTNKTSKWLVAGSLLALAAGCSDSNPSISPEDTAIQAPSTAGQSPGPVSPVVQTPGPVAQTPAQTPAQPSTAMTANDFTFPAVTETNGVISVEIPQSPLPTFSARRTLSSGTGSTVQFGDPVVLRYTMYNWSMGELIENTDTFDEPVAIQAGVTSGVPDFLSKSLLGRNIGDRIQVIFEPGMEDLPEYLDANNAYVLVVDLL